MSRATLAKRADDVRSMFDSVAPRYDLVNDVSSLGFDRSWREATRRAIGARPGERVLDVAAGTITSTEPLADAGVDAVACDFSLGMLAVGHRRRPDIDAVAADATALPFADESFDAVTISFGLRNVDDVPGALAEFARVTRPGGRLVVCEFSTPTWAPFSQLYSVYLRYVLPQAARVSASPEAYTYLAESIVDWPDQSALGRLILRSGWGRVEYRNLTGGIVALHRATKAGAFAVGATSVPANAQ